MTPPGGTADGTMARFGKILLATDLTSASSSATEEAVELAVRLDARLLVMSVLETGKGGVPRRGVRPEVRDARSREVQAVVGQARAAGADASFLVWEGEAGEAITSAAEAEQVDLIVVGSPRAEHGRPLPAGQRLRSRRPPRHVPGPGRPGARGRFRPPRAEAHHRGRARRAVDGVPRATSCTCRPDRARRG